MKNDLFDLKFKGNSYIYSDTYFFGGQRRNRQASLFTFTGSARIEFMIIKFEGERLDY